MDEDGRRVAGSLRLAAAALGLCLVATGAAAQAPLQVSYSTDAYLTCDSLKDEIARMDAMIAVKGASQGTIKVARERKAVIAGLHKTKGCDGAPKEADPSATRTFLSPY